MDPMTRRGDLKSFKKVGVYFFIPDSYDGEGIRFSADNLCHLFSCTSLLSRGPSVMIISIICHQHNFFVGLLPYFSNSSWSAWWSTDAV